MPVVPHRYGTEYSLFGSCRPTRFMMSGSMCCRFGIWLLSIFWNTPALIWRSRNEADGTTTSKPELPASRRVSSTSFESKTS